MKNQIRTWLIALGCSLLLILMAGGAFAQPDHSIAIRYTGYNYLTTFGSDDFGFREIFSEAQGSGIEFAYYNRLLPHLLLGIPFQFGEIQYPEGLGFKSKQNTFGLDAMLQFHPVNYGYWIDPYIHAGVGVNYITGPEEFGFGFPVGIGLNFELFPDFYLSVQTQYNISLDDRPGWHHGIGFHLFLGGEDEVVLPLDSDGDGVTDEFDSCPEIPGPSSNRGCPELTREDWDKVEVAINMVQFETAKAVLLPESYPVLDNIVDIMKRYPYYSLKISGHTDSVDDDAYNLTLSKERARACFDYFVSRGITASRMSHDGYGESRPRATNDTEEGRALNRRVEFELMVK